MREIKFRGYNVVENRWIYGDLVHKATNAGSKIVDVAIAPRGCYPIEVDPNSVGQYLCRKDKNGIELYEKDVVVHKRVIEFGDDYATGEPTGTNKTITRKGALSLTPSQGIVLTGVLSEWDDIDDVPLIESVKWRGSLTRFEDFSVVVGNSYLDGNAVPFTKYDSKGDFFERKS